MWVMPGRLPSQVTDDGPTARDGAGRAGRRLMDRTGDQAEPWPCRRGMACGWRGPQPDQISAASGPGGSRITMMFALPGRGRIPGPADGHARPPKR